jgi:hypothetical protein
MRFIAILHEVSRLNPPYWADYLSTGKTLFASGGVLVLNGREPLFGEARELTARIVLLFDWGGEEK